MHNREGYNHDRYAAKAVLFRQMEKSEQRFVVKFFFSKALAPRKFTEN
jgi:hypothetical protein